MFAENDWKERKCSAPPPSLNVCSPSERPGFAATLHLHIEDNSDKDHVHQSSIYDWEIFLSGMWYVVCVETNISLKTVPADEDKIDQSKIGSGWWEAVETNISLKRAPAVEPADSCSPTTPPPSPKQPACLFRFCEPNTYLG